MYDGEVPVVWIVEVAGVVDVYNSLVGRSRSGGVGRVKQAGDVRSAGGWSVLMLSEHSVFEGYGQKHEHKEGGGGDGGWRAEGWGGMERRGRSTYLYTGRVAQNAVLGSNTVSFIFSQEAHSEPSRLGFPPYYYYFREISNSVICGLFIFDFDAGLRLATTRLPAGSCNLERGATMAPGVPFEVTAYKPILAFPISLRSAVSLQIIFVIIHPSLSLLSRRNLAFGHGTPLYFCPSCLYPYTVIGIYLVPRMCPARGLRTYLSHLRIFATSHAHLS